VKKPLLPAGPSVPMTEREVEVEVYERLYGLPRRDSANGGADDRLVIGDRDGLAPGATDAMDRVSGPMVTAAHPPVGRAHLGHRAATIVTRAVATLRDAIPAGAGLIRGGAEPGRAMPGRAGSALATALDRADRAMAKAQSAIERSPSAIGRRRVALAGLAVALFAVVLAVLLSSGSGSTPTNARAPAPLLAAPPGQPAVSQPPVRRRPARSPVSLAPRSTPVRETPATRAPTSPVKRRSHRTMRRRTTRPQHTGSHRAPRPRAPSKRPRAPQRAEPPTSAPPPTASTPTTSSGGVSPDAPPAAPDATE
jgi:hypothetical protein